MTLTFTKEAVIGTMLSAALLGLAACAPVQSALLARQSRSPALSQQFDLVNKDGVEIACPESWHLVGAQHATS